MALDETSKHHGVISDDARRLGCRLPPDEPLDSAAAAEEERQRQLLESAQAGDRDAFRSLVELHQDRVFRLMRRMLRCDRDTAADLTQEVFLRVFRGLAGFNGRAKFTTWLHKIAMNVGISEYRHRRALKRNKWTFSIDAPMPGTDDLYAEPPSKDPGPSDQVHFKEVAKAVRAAVQDLPEEFRQAVMLRDLQGLSYEEIGEILDVPPGTVRSRIHRGRLLLQERLSEFRP